MKCMKSKLYQAKIDSSDEVLLHPWRLLLDEIGKGQIGFIVKSLHSSLKKDNLSTSIITIYLNDDKAVIISSFSFSEEESLSPIQVKEGFLDFFWDILSSTWEGWTEKSELNPRAHFSIRRCLERDISIEEYKKK